MEKTFKKVHMTAGSWEEEFYNKENGTEGFKTKSSNNTKTNKKRIWKRTKPTK